MKITKDKIRKRLRQFLKASREADALTMRDVAARTGFPLSKVFYIEHARCDLSVYDLVRLARALEMDKEELFVLITK